jgi:hypothetical protein
MQLLFNDFFVYSGIILFLMMFAGELLVIIIEPVYN